MDRTTRERMLSGTDQADVTTGNALWQTPPAVFAKLHDEYGFDVDLFARDESALMPIWLGPGSTFYEDAISTPWMDCGTVGFSNPPYGDFIASVLYKAHREAREGFRSVHLLPLRLTRAMRTTIFRTGTVEEWLFPDKRITFFEQGSPRYTTKPDNRGFVHAMPAMFDSTILVLGPDAALKPRVSEWVVPDHVPTEMKKRQA